MYILCTFCNCEYFQDFGKFLVFYTYVSPVQECDRKVAEIASLEEREREVQVELRRAREELKLEREKWDAEREGYKQVSWYGVWWLLS